MGIARYKWLLIGILGGGALAGAGANVSRFMDREQPGPPLHLVVNIPASRLEVFRGDSLLGTYPVSPGRPGYETPAGTYKITHLIWNPWWHPPESRWARNEKPVPPGPGNPMGLVKMFFDDLYYIHGTPNVKQLGEPASHGCVRMANGDAIQVARLVQEYGAPGAPVASTDEVASGRSTRTVWLKTPVTLEVRYAVAEVREGQLEIHRDVYGSARGTVRERVVQALVQNGYAPDQLDPQRLDELVKRARRSPVVVPVDSVLASGAGAIAAGGAQR